MNNHDSDIYLISYGSPYTPTPKPVRRFRDKRTWRQPYRGSRRFDATCRCHGGCSYCESGRAHRWQKRIEVLETPSG